MSETIGFSERVYTELRDNFPAGASATSIAGELDLDPTKVAQTLNALAKRSAVERCDKDDEGRQLFKANPDAKFNRPRRAATGAGARGSSPRRRRTKADDRGQVHSASRQLRTAETAGRDRHLHDDPKPRFAIDDSYSVAITTGATGVILDRAAALKLLEFLGSMEPLLSSD